MTSARGRRRGVLPLVLLAAVALLTASRLPGLLGSDSGGSGDLLESDGARSAATETGPPVVLEASAPTRETFADDALSRLRRRIDGERARLRPGTRSSILVLDPTTGQTLYEHEPDRTLVPASNMKIVTAATALTRLGPDHAFETRFRTTAPLDGGVLRGDLVVSGCGDPTLARRFFGDDPMAPMHALAAMLVEAGLRRVEGRLLADSSAFSGPRTGRAWPDDPPWRTWMVDVQPLVFNDGRVRVVCEVDGRKATARLEPDVGYGTITSRLALTSERKRQLIVLDRAAAANEFTVSGRLWQNVPAYEADANVHDGALYFLAALKKALAARQIDVTAGIGHAAPPRAARSLTPLFVYTSPLRRSVSPMLKLSQNLYAELIFRAVGAKVAGEGSFEASRAAVHDWLQEERVPPEGLAVADGSGLSRANAVSAHQLAAILVAMAKKPGLAEVFRDSLAVPSEEGTLRKRMHELRDDVRAKTGTLDGVSALSGYVRAGDGRWLVFASIFNDCRVAEARRLQDLLCRAAHELDVPG